MNHIDIRSIRRWRFWNGLAIWLKRAPVLIPVSVDQNRGLWYSGHNTHTLHPPALKAHLWAHFNNSAHRLLPDDEDNAERSTLWSYFISRDLERNHCPHFWCSFSWCCQGLHGHQADGQTYCLQPTPLDFKCRTFGWKIYILTYGKARKIHPIHNNICLVFLLFGSPVL